MNDFMLSAADTTRLQALLDTVASGTAGFLGYPVAKDFDYSPLMPFLQYPLNNLGDPFIPSTYAVGSRDLEKEVVAFFAQLFRAPANDWWGYVTNGGSEGNLYALYLARELYPKAMVYYSAATHYSVQKNIHLLNMPAIVIRTQDNGEMDYEDLENTISMNRQLPVIILANIGTTMTEARDDVKRIRAILNKTAIRQFYIHADGALSGSYSGFLENRPAFDFADGAHSIAISGHKFIGSPVPCGVVIAHKSYRDRIARSVAYIGTLDTTITGSRNGHSPLFLWYALKRYGIEGMRARAVAALEVAAYATNRLLEIGVAAWRNPDTLTVVFPEPPASIRLKWQLASENGWSHIICMPGVTKALIDTFINELENALPETPQQPSYNLNFA
ncbi:histidine decarboxylase [Chitinophaga sp. Hz27]|uniref:histidine decarboxylase n=1 Tax=Chitinophaga sp. Hz27 TaxID=3347169 RepID=UPI0035D8EC4B